MFRATHIGGPLAGSENDVSMASPRVMDKTFWVKAPTPEQAITAAGYILIGYEPAPEPLVPFEGQIAYALDRGASDLYDHPEYEGMEIGTAVYRFES